MPRGVYDRSKLKKKTEKEEAVEVKAPKKVGRPPKAKTIEAAAQKTEVKRGEMLSPTPTGRALSASGMYHLFDLTATIKNFAEVRSLIGSGNLELTKKLDASIENLVNKAMCLFPDQVEETETVAEPVVAAPVAVPVAVPQIPTFTPVAPQAAPLPFNVPTVNGAQS